MACYSFFAKQSLRKGINCSYCCKMDIIFWSGLNDSFKSLFKNIKSIFIKDSELVYLIKSFSFKWKLIWNTNSKYLKFNTCSSWIGVLGFWGFGVLGFCNFTCEITN